MSLSYLPQEKFLKFLRFTCFEPVMFLKFGVNTLLGEKELRFRQNVPHLVSDGGISLKVSTKISNLPYFKFTILPNSAPTQSPSGLC